MFSDRQLKALKPADKPYKKFEGGNIPGFCVQVSPSGAKTFYLNFTFEGRRPFMSLGRYPAVTLQQARERAHAAREEIDRGNNPMVTSTSPQAKGRQRTGTVRDAVELYVEDMEKRNCSSAEQVRGSMEKHVLPELGDLLARDIRPGHVQKVIAAVINSGVTQEHNAVRSRFHAAMQFALHYDHDPKALLRRVRFGMHYNPVAAVPKDKTAKQGLVERNLSFAEIKAMWDFDGWHHLPHTALKTVLALGGLRINEVLGMTKDELDFSSNTFTIPPERFKGRRYHVVPIGSLARELLAKPVVPELESSYIFPTISKDNQLDYYRVASLGRYLSRQWTRKNWPQGVARFTPYDMRRTFKTRTGEMGIAKELRDRVQGHAMSDVSSKHYDRWDYLPEKREVIEAWDERLRSTVG